MGIGDLFPIYTGKLKKEMGAGARQFQMGIM